MIKMKNSGIEWIGEIPDDWEIINLGNLLKEHKIPNEGLNTLALQFKFGTIVRKKEREITPEIIEVLSNYNVVEPNNIMINGLNLAFDFITQRVAIVKEKGVITSTYIAIMPTTNYYPQYATYLLKSYDNQKVFHALGRGLRCMLSYDILKREKVLYPPLYVQQKIADYLDKKCAAVDRLIGNQQAQIEKLKEYKQSVITEAVIRGLDPSVPMKDSGVEWIRQIPKKWHIVRIKNLPDYTQENAFMDGDWIESPDITDEGIRYLTTGNIGDGIFKRQGNGYISYDTFVKLNCKYAYPNDLVIARLNSPFGRSCILPSDEKQYVLAVDIVILRTNQNKKFICYVTQCPNFQHSVEDYSRGTAMKRISRSNLGLIRIGMPPLEEQQQIADYLDKKCAEIDKLIAIKQQKIETLTEYKKSLIYEYVTGKKQVV